MKRSYLCVIRLLEKTSGKLFVAVFYPSGTFEWLPVDKSEYLRQLKQIGNPEIDYPCLFEVDSDEDCFIHPKVENKG